MLAVNENQSPQSKGGVARSESLTKEEKRTIAQRAAKARWDAAKQLEDPTRTPELSAKGSWK